MTMRARVLRTLRSGRTAIALLLATAITAAAGTLYTPEQAREAFLSTVGEQGAAVAKAVGFVDVFRGPLFAALLLAVVINVSLCTWHRLPLIGVFSSPYPGGPLRRWTVLADATMHLSLIVVLAAAAVESRFGFVGTKNIPVGVSEGMVFDWRAGREVPLGFEIEIEKLGMSFFPVVAKIGVTDIASEKRLGLLTALEGGRSEIDGGDLELEDLRYDPRSSTLEMVAIQQGKPVQVRFSTSQKGPTTAIAGRHRLTLVAWRRDLREVLAEVAIRESGQDVQRGLLKVNGMMRHRGWELYLTGWGRDEYGIDFAGIQVARKPGALFFWIGSALFSACLPLYLFLRRGVSDSRRLARD